MRVAPVIVLLLLAGCQSGRSGPPPVAADRQSNGASSAGQLTKPIAYINGQNVRITDLQSDVLEQAGGVVLREYILDTQLRERLARENIQINAQDLAAEKQRVLLLLSPDADQATRLLESLRERRGLGPVRFEKFLWRNAALRALTADQVDIAEADLRRAFALRYGERYRVRLIVVGNVTQAQGVRRELDGGKPFFQAAIDHSTDRSAARGGLLAPMHLQDPTYPAVLRQVVGQLEPGQVSQPVALEQGVALVKLEEKVPARLVGYEAVRAELERDVRLEAQEQRMRQLALTLVGEADVLILDPALQHAWDRARRAAAASP